MEEDTIVHTPQVDIESLLTTYLKRLVFPTLIAVTLIVVSTIKNAPSSFSVLIHGLLVMDIVIELYKGKTHYDWQKVALLGAIAGSLVGLASAITKLVINFHIARIFNLVTESVFSGILDSIAVAFIYMIIQFIHTRKEVQHK